MARILVVDDEPGIRSFLATVLSREGHEVTQAPTGEEALKVLTHQAQALVITDLKMPGITGLELLGRIQSEHTETEVILLTAHGTIDTAVEAMRKGAFDYLQKPLRSPAELREVTARAIERHRLKAHTEITQTGPIKLTWGAPSMVPVQAALTRVARTNATVLLLGESGAGKEVAARALHATSDRANAPFVAINCATLSPNLLESELFGHEKGSFTGATARKRGKIELATGGTFFLDEVGELAIELQARLLRVIQERKFERVGGEQTVDADVRWVAATNRDLKQNVREGKFREDLYYRLSVFPIALPPLRERREDLRPLAEILLAKTAQSLGRPTLKLTEPAHRAIQQNDWPGNVRELSNAIERAAIMADTDEVGPEFLGGPIQRSSLPELPTLAEVEEITIRNTLEHFEGNRRKAAEHLGIGERTLYDKLKRFGLS